VTATVTTWHRVSVSPVGTGWVAGCQSGDCIWARISTGPGAWQAAVGKALAHVDETKEEA
jgi:hypothetical protein